MNDRLETLIAEGGNNSTQNQKSMETIRSEYPFESHYIDINGHLYHYIDEGEGIPILMVHGNPSWSFYYRRLIKAFSKKYRVIAPDHMGCGLSDKPQNYEYHLENHIDNLETLILRLNLRRITLIVHDWGAPIGIGCAIRNQHLFTRFIILNSAGYIPDTIPWYIHLFRVPFLGDFLVRNLNLYTGNYNLFTPQHNISPMIAQGMFLPYNSYENRIGIYKFLQDVPIAPSDFSFEMLLQIEYGLWMFRDRPVAIIWGMNDQCYNPEKYLSRWRKTYPQAKLLEIEYAGYFLLEDAPVTVARFISNFFDETGILDDE